MRYIALVILVWLIVTFIIHKIKELDILESLYLSLLFLFALNSSIFIIFLFIKFW